MNRLLVVLPLLVACAGAPPLEPLPAGRRLDLDFAWPAETRLAVETTRTLRIIGQRGPSLRAVVVRRTLEVVAIEDGLLLRFRGWSVERPEEGWTRETLALAFEELAVPDLRLTRDGTLAGTEPDFGGGREVAERLVNGLAPMMKAEEGRALIAAGFAAEVRAERAAATWHRWIGAWRRLPLTGGRPIHGTETLRLDGPPVILDSELTVAGFGPCGDGGGRCVVLDRRAWLPPQRTELLAARLASAHPGKGEPVGIELAHTARCVADPATLLPAAVDWTEILRADFDTGDAFQTYQIDSYDESRTRFRPVGAAEGASAP